MPEDILSVLGSRLRKARNDRDFTQERLSDVSGVSARHIANIEKGDVNPSFEILHTLIKALGVSFDSIFDPADEQLETDIQEITGLYRACPEQGRRLILVSIRAMARELMDTNTGQQPKKRSQQVRKGFCLSASLFHL